MQTGLDTLLRDPQRLRSLATRRVALLANPASMTSVRLGFEHALDALRAELGNALCAAWRSIAKIESLPCDIILSVHPGFTGMSQKLKIRSTGGTPDPFVDPEGCRSYAADMRRRLDAKLAAER